MVDDTLRHCFEVSVPIRGLFNLTIESLKEYHEENASISFRPHQGII